MSEFSVGHNSGATEEGVLNRAAINSLRDLISRIEEANNQAEAVKEDLKELYKEGKEVGFDTKIIRRVIALRKADKAKIDEENAMIDLYMSVLLG